MSCVLLFRAGRFSFLLFLPVAYCPPKTNIKNKQKTKRPVSNSKNFERFSSVSSNDLLLLFYFCWCRRLVVVAVDCVVVVVAAGVKIAFGAEKKNKWKW